MKKRILSLYLPRLAINRHARKAPALWHNQPLIITARLGNRKLVTALNHPAESQGLHPGMTEADARALAPGLLTIADDKAADAKFLRILARWCYRFTPRIALDGADGLLLDITGCARLFNGEAALQSSLLAKLETLGLQAKTAIAPTPGAAHALARFTNTNPIIAPGAIRPALQALPPEALRLAPNIIASLYQLGLTSINHLHELPPKALIRRFGEETWRRLEQAHDHQPEPLSFITIHPAFKVTLTLAEPLLHQKAIEIGAEKLLHQLCEKLTTRAEGLRQLTLTLEQSNHSATTLHIGTAKPLADPASIMRLLRLKLDSLEKGFDIGYGIDRMHLHAIHTAPLEARQVDITGHTSGHSHSSASGNKDDNLTSLLDRLAVQLGAENIQRFTPAQSHIPERGFTSHSAQYITAQHLPAQSPSGHPLRQHSAGPHRMAHHPRPPTLSFQNAHPPRPFKKQQLHLPAPALSHCPSLGAGAHRAGMVVG